jgi:DNA-binding NarL/FixJ family response regulator
MRRREFIKVIGGAAAWPLAAHAQQAVSMRCIGILLDAKEDRVIISPVLSALESLGYALAALKANGGIDVVVTDINMPRMDGLALLQKLQESDENISTIIVSAYGDMGNIRTAMNRGAFDFVTKPIDFRDLEATIAKTIRHIEYLRDARRRQAEAERAYMSLSRYFSPNLAQRLARDSDAVGLCGQRREIATLFTDITGFTAPRRDVAAQRARATAQ